MPRPQHLRRCRTSVMGKVKAIYDSDIKPYVHQRW